MAKVIREERVVDEPEERVVVTDRDSRPRNNTGLVILGVIIVLVLLFLLFGNGFGGGGGGNAPAPANPASGY